MADTAEEFPNQSSLCASCGWGVRHVYIDMDEALPMKKLIYLCHSKMIRGNENPRPSPMTDLVVECEAYLPDQALVTP